MLVVDGVACSDSLSRGPRDVEIPLSGGTRCTSTRAWNRGLGSRLHAGALANLQTDELCARGALVLDNNEARCASPRPAGLDRDRRVTKIDRGLEGQGPLQERRLRRDVRGRLSPTRPARARPAEADDRA